MTDKDRCTEALEVMKNFMMAMHSWESDFFKERKKNLPAGKDDDFIKFSYAEKLENLLNEFVLKNKSNFGRLIDLGCTNPPTYNPTSDKIESVSSVENEVDIVIQQEVGAELKSKISLILKDGSWKIKSKYILGYDDKWKRSPL